MHPNFSPRLQAFLARIESDEIPFYEEDYSPETLEALLKEHEVDRNELLAYHFQKDSVAAMQALLFHFPVLWVDLKREDWLTIGKFLSEDEMGIYHFSYWLAEVLDWSPEQFWREVHQSQANTQLHKLFRQSFPNGLTLAPISAQKAKQKWGLDLEAIRRNAHNGH